MSAAFWDASALALLCVEQEASPRARAVRSRHGEVVAWWGSTVEVSGAIERAARAGLLDAAGRRGALGRLTRISTAWDEVAPAPRIRELACDALSRHDLRAADAVQLAAALLAVRERPRHQPFVVFDRKLAAAARAEGFAALP